MYEQFLPFDCFVVFHGMDLCGLCNHEAIEEPFGCSQLLAILNKAAMSVPV